jgi:hypothetical protein
MLSLFPLAFVFVNITFEIDYKNTKKKRTGKKYFVSHPNARFLVAGNQ